MPASIVWGSEWRAPEISVDSLSAEGGASSLESVATGVVNYILADDDREKDDDDDERDDDKDDDDDDKRKGDDRKAKDERDHKDEHKKEKGKDKHDNGDNDEDEDHDDDGPRGGGNHNDEDDPPGAQAVTVDEDSFVSFVLQHGSANRESITFEIVEQPNHGSLDALNATSGEVTYRPSSNFFGEDSLTFVAHEGDRDGKPSTVEIRVKGVNDAPVAAGIQFTTREGRSFSFVLKGFDVDGDALKFTIMSEPDHGELVGAAPNLSYTPDGRFDGVDDFTFTVSDGTLESNVARVAITVKEEDDNDNNRSWQKPQPAPKTSASATQVQNNGVVTPSSFEPPVTESPVYSPVTELTPNIAGVDAAIVLGGTAATAIKDLIAPQLIFPAASIEAIATSLEGTIVNYSVRATDDTDGDIETSCSPSSGSKFPVGRFNVVCYATDAAGNSALSSFVVIVRPDLAGDDSLPAFLLPSVLAAVLGAGAYVGLMIYRRNTSLS